MINIPMNTKPSMNLNSTGSQPSLSLGGNVQNNGYTPNMSSGQPMGTMSTPQMHTQQGGGVILKKGQRTSLTEMNPNLDKIRVCLGWDVGNNTAYDLDASAFMLGSNGKVIGDDWFVYYNQQNSPDYSVCCTGDNKDGSGFGDDEVINVQLSRVNQQVDKIVFVVTINEARERGHNFGQVSNAYIRIVDESNNKELVKFNLTDYYSNVTSMMVGELYRKNGQWRILPIGDGTADDLLGLCIRYGVNVAG